MKVRILIRQVKMENKTRNIGISNKELQLIFHLKANVWEILPDSISSKSEEDQNLFFVRWIRAREHDLEKSTEMLRNHLQWRLERNADQVLNTLPHPFFMENYRFFFPGVDLKGQPVGCIALAEWDFRKVINRPERLPEFDNFVTFVFETSLSKLENAQNERSPNEPPVTQLTLIIDAKNYPYGQLMRFQAIKKIIEVASVYEAHYPEILYKAFFINCPSYFGMFINLIKPVLATRTMEKLTFYSNMNQWKAEINNFVDPTTVPEKYGGLSKAVL